MSDDFGTVKQSRGERSREIEILRQRYGRHRQALNEMAADAPTEHLATEYRRLIQELDGALLKLDELEGKTPSVPPAVAPAQHEPVRQHGDPLRPKSGVAAAAGMRPLATPPRGGYDEHAPAEPAHYEGDEGAPRSRAAIIAVVALIALALIGWVIWSYVDREEPAAIADETTIVPLEPAVDNTIAPAGSPAALGVNPPAHDFGVVRKGTRATRQYEVTNNTDEPMSIQIARSTCRCLYYEHAEVIPPRAKDSVTVTVDGARAPVGELSETIRVSSKSDPPVTASFEVNATIR